MSDFGLGDLFGQGPNPYGPPYGSKPPKEEKAVPWEAKELDGRLYVPLEQVAQLLEINGVLPKMQERAKMHVQNLKDKNALDI